MKTILKVTTVIALVLNVAIGSAKDSEINVIPSKETKSLVLTLDRASVDLTVRFLDTDDNILYAEKIKNGTVTKKFNLQNLENGLYYITATDANKIVIYTVSLEGDAVKIIGKDETVKPYFRKTKERLFVNYLNLDKSEVSIKVYDEENRVVFSETVIDAMIVEKAFNFEGAYAGNYSIIVSNAKKSFAENFIVD
jgi:flagellar hook assembly protein FlgD